MLAAKLREREFPLSYERDLRRHVEEERTNRFRRECAEKPLLETEVPGSPVPELQPDPRIAHKTVVDRDSPAPGIVERGASMEPNVREHDEQGPSMRYQRAPLTEPLGGTGGKVVVGERGFDFQRLGTTVKGS